MLLVLYICLGVITFFLINGIGKFLLPTSYQNDLFDDPHESDTVFNIAYRVIAPVVILVIEGLLCDFVIQEFQFKELQFSCIVYWLLRAICWIIKHRTVKTRFLMIVAQAATSSLICWYLTVSIGEDPVVSLMPNIEDVSMEFTILIFLVIFFILAESPFLRKDDSLATKKAEYEKRLFQIDQVCRDVFTKRYIDDVALKILFYTFALVEDTYRPSWIRWIEGQLLKSKMTFLVKTAGLMQVPTEVPISDEKSVELAMIKVSAIYDAFLKESSNLAIDPYSGDYRLTGVVCNLPCLTFYKEGYSYKLGEMLNLIGEDISRLYGKYCGTYQLEIWDAFFSAREFVHSQYGKKDSDTIEVDFKINHKWGDLPFRGYWRLGRDLGFACLGSEETAWFLVKDNEKTVELAKVFLESKLEDKILLYYDNLPGAIIVISGGVDRKNMEVVASKLSMTLKDGDYRFSEIHYNAEEFFNRWLMGHSQSTPF